MNFKEDDEITYNCILCKDTGVVDIMEPVEEGLMAPIGERTCDCQITEEDTNE